MTFKKPSVAKGVERKAEAIQAPPVEKKVRARHKSVQTKRLAPRLIVEDKKAFERVCQMANVPMTVMVERLMNAWLNGTIKMEVRHILNPSALCERLVLDPPLEAYRAYKAKAGTDGVTLTDVVGALVKRTDLILRMVKGEAMLDGLTC
ncbi:hypothetical protein OVY01_11840 [Robbsia sp. Bb-Pol-6]|uniref:Uncharacterized protein n=1 Tax=Robbsia betulipollinis TaxID=2981849 RepID=A0ABT3ZMX6_9BURK|nr:hypothetical protein [Robbsia betulipollinis]